MHIIIITTTYHITYTNHTSSYQPTNSHIDARILPTCRAHPSAIWSVVPGPRPSKEVHTVGLGASTTTTTWLELAKRYLVTHSHPMMKLLLTNIKVSRIPRSADKSKLFLMIHPDNRAVPDIICWSFRGRHNIRSTFPAYPVPGSWHSTAYKRHRVSATHNTRPGSRLVSSTLSRGIAYNLGFLSRFFRETCILQRRDHTPQRFYRRTKKAISHPGVRSTCSQLRQGLSKVTPEAWS